MTNEEAIDYIERWKTDYSVDAKDREVLSMAIKALEQQPCEDWYDVPSDEMTLEQARQAVKDLRKKLGEYLEQQPSEDCISRQAVLDTEYQIKEINGIEYVMLSEVQMKIRKMPSVTPRNNLAETLQDCISRTDVLALAEKGTLVSNGNYKSVCKAINDLPSVTPKTEWIPVSERLPEDCQFVLMTIRRMDERYNHEPFISVGYISWNQSVWWCAHDGECKLHDVRVDAWMPLPQPYKVESESKRYMELAKSYVQGLRVGLQAGLAESEDKNESI